MKTAISVPDDTFERVTRTAREQGISRSEFFTRAATAYLQELEDRNLTSRIDAGLELTGKDPNTPLVTAASQRWLRNLDDEW